MKQKFYLQTDEVNRVTDIIEFPYSDYKEVELNVPLPPNILGRCYELLADNSIVYRREWDTKELEREEQLREQQEVLDALLIAQLEIGGV